VKPPECDDVFVGKTFRLVNLSGRTPPHGFSSDLIWTFRSDHHRRGDFIVISPVGLATKTYSVLAGGEANILGAVFHLAFVEHSAAVLASLRRKFYGRVL
jgi:hypothetical protein